MCDCLLHCSSLQMNRYCHSWNLCLAVMTLLFSIHSRSSEGGGVLNVVGIKILNTNKIVLILFLFLSQCKKQHRQTQLSLLNKSLWRINKILKKSDRKHTRDVIHVELKNG